MFTILKKHKIISIIVLIDLFLYWLLCQSNIVLPFINPSIELYETHKNSGTSFPRNTNQIVLWICLQIPAIFYFFVYTLKHLLGQKKL